MLFTKSKRLMRPLIIALAAYVIGGTPIGKKTELYAYSQSLPNTVGTMVLHSAAASSAGDILKDLRSFFIKAHESFIETMLDIAKISSETGLREGYKAAITAINNYESSMLGLLDNIIVRLEKILAENKDIEPDFKLKVEGTLKTLIYLKSNFVSLLVPIRDDLKRGKNPLNDKVIKTLDGVGKMIIDMYFMDLKF